MRARTRLFAELQTWNWRRCRSVQEPVARPCGPAALLAPRTLTRQAWASLERPPTGRAFAEPMAFAGVTAGSRRPPLVALSALVFSVLPSTPSFVVSAPSPLPSASTRRLPPHLIWLFIIREFRDSALCIALSSPLSSSLLFWHTPRISYSLAPPFPPPHLFFPCPPLLHFPQLTAVLRQ